MMPPIITPTTEAINAQWPTPLARLSKTAVPGRLLVLDGERLTLVELARSKWWTKNCKCMVAPWLLVVTGW